MPGYARQGKMRSKLREAILAGFNPASLDQTLSDNDRLQPNIAMGPDYVTRVNSLLDVARQEGWLIELCGVLAAARSANQAVSSAILDVQKWLTEQRDTNEIDLQFQQDLNFTGGVTAGITPIQLQQITDAVRGGRAIPPEFKSLSQRFGVTDMAVANFFRILGERKVPIEDLDAKLREIAAHHLTLVRQVKSLSGEDPQVASIKKEAAAAVGVGDYGRAEALLQQAYDADLVAARKTQDAANQRFVTAAKTKADLGQLKWSQLQSDAAAREFRTAADLVPVSELDLRAQYLLRSGAAALEAGAYPRAESALTDALHIQEKLLAPDQIDLAWSLNQLGRLYLSLHRYAEAEPLFSRALAIGERVVGPEHQDVGAFLNSLALLHRGQGHYTEAEPLFNRALAIAEKALGPEDPMVGAFLNNLAGLQEMQRRYAEAEPLYRRALAIDEKALGPGHPDVAIDLNNLAMLYREQGHYAEAEPLFNRAVAIGENALGPAHPTVGGFIGDLALLYARQNRFAEAEPLQKRALAISEKAFGPEHPQVGIHLNNLAGTYGEQGRYAEAASLMKRALLINEKALGMDNPNTEIVRRNLQGLLQAMTPAPDASREPSDAGSG